jgi:trans-aconitate 2-methyltransferase
MHWDPAQYGRYSSERSRPFFDLTAQIGAISPSTVVDLGCGSGELTATLANRWPSARVSGVDSSTEMIAAAPPDGQVSFSVGTAEQFDAHGVDVLVSNAVLQWVPGHLQLLSRWADELNAGGWLAFQVPANFSSPSHRLMRELSESSRWRPRLGRTLRHDDAVAEPDAYLDLLIRAGLIATVWQTTYFHVLPGEDPVLEWVRGSGLRPVLQALDEPEREEFVAEYAAALRRAYPQREYGTVFPFIRTFAVAHKPLWESGNTHHRAV